MDFETILSLPWDVIDVIINFLELLVLCVPAVVIFMYYKLKSVEIQVIEATKIGAKFIVHNKTNRSVFITQISFVPLKNSNFINPVVVFNEDVLQLKPDECFESVINYKMQSNVPQEFRLVVHYDNNKQKRIKAVAQ